MVLKNVLHKQISEQLSFEINLKYRVQKLLRNLWSHLVSYRVNKISCRLSLARFGNLSPPQKKKLGSFC